MKTIFILPLLLMFVACENVEPPIPVKQPTPIVIETPEPPKVEEPVVKDEEPAPPPKKKKKAVKQQKYQGEQPVATTPGALRKPLEK